MKKILVVILMVVGSSFSSQAQVNEHALGVRLASSNFFWAPEVSYQFGLSQRNRLEFDAGAVLATGNWMRTRLSGIFHWDWNIFNSLNWYIGPGAQVGFYQDFDNANNSGLTVAVGGQIGLEYDFKKQFDVPVLVSLDVRPMFDFLRPDPNVLLWLPAGALSARYVF